VTRIHHKLNELTERTITVWRRHERSPLMAISGKKTAQKHAVLRIVANYVSCVAS